MLTFDADMFTSTLPKLPFCPTGKEAIDGLLDTKEFSNSFDLYPGILLQLPGLFSCNLKYNNCLYFVNLDPIFLLV